MNQQFKKLRVRILAFVLVVAMLSGVMLKEGTVTASAAGNPYLIKINRVACTVTIYKQDNKGNYTVPVKAMLCSPGWETPLGTFKTPQKLRWHILMDDVWGQYCTRINGGILFHSVWYYYRDPSTLSNKQFNKLGTVCSHGCVRLNVEDAKWIYDNCPLGTTVVIYDDAKNPGPLGKPAPIKLPSSSGQGYDPTDIWSPGNPYIKKIPVISGVKDQTLTYASKVDVLKGVTAKSTLGTNITSQIKVSIELSGKTVKEIDCKKSGKYVVTYTVTDQMGRTAAQKATYTVKGSTASPVLEGLDELVVKGGTVVDQKMVMKGVKAIWEGRTLTTEKIKVDIKDNETEYEITYTVKAPNGKTTKETRMIYLDSSAPMITGMADKEIAWDTQLSDEFIKEGLKVSDDFTKMKKEDIKATVKEDKENKKYIVTYEATDEVGNIGTATATFTVTDFLRIEGVENQSVPDEMAVTEYYALQEGIRAFDGETDITNTLRASIEQIEPGIFEVTYTVKDAAGHKEEVRAVFTKKSAAGTEPESYN